MDGMAGCSNPYDGWIVGRLIQLSPMSALVLMVSVISERDFLFD